MIICHAAPNTNTTGDLRCLGAAEVESARCSLPPPLTPRRANESGWTGRATEAWGGDLSGSEGPLSPVPDLCCGSDGSRG